ncbi:hypothetical protein SUGI_0364180 [Cryptomeria japonica]|nr:hypothetical protein SUGI_0364180 [Cryptomeria japonica]
MQFPDALIGSRCYDLGGGWRWISLLNSAEENLVKKLQQWRLIKSKARECLLDLDAFLESGKISANELLTIWVDVKKLEWQDAFVILLELAGKSLLNLTSNLGRAISYESA